MNHMHFTKFARSYHVHRKIYIIVWKIYVYNVFDIARFYIMNNTCVGSNFLSNFMLFFNYFYNTNEKKSLLWQ